MSYYTNEKVICIENIQSQDSNYLILSSYEYGLRGGNRKQLFSSLKGLKKWSENRECWLCGCLRPFFLLNSTKFLFPEYLLLLGAILMGRSVRCILHSYLWNLSHSWWTSGGSYLLEELALMLICCCSTAREEVFWVGSGVIFRVLGCSTSGSNFLSSK